LKVGAASITVTQDAAVPTCDFTVKPQQVSVDAGGGTRNIDVHTSKDCKWTAESNVTWIVVTSGASGNGNGSVDLRIEANADSVSRTGTVRVAGVDVVVQQDAAQPISVAGDVSQLSGKCPTVTFAVDQRSVYTSGATMYVGGSCQKLKNRQHIETLGLPRTDGGLEALTVTFDADLLQ
jgi:hypothetical protein